MAKVSDVVKIALAEVGYKEKASNSQLDNPTANAGSNNYTKYARDLRDAGYYNGNKNGFAWCDVFVDWCFYKAFGKTEGQRIECQTGDLGAGCKYSKQYYQNKGRCDRMPKVGDQIFFTSGGTISHTGIVTAVNGDKVTTVEGNSGDQVKKHTYSLSNSYIDSFGHPLYDEEKPKAEPEKPAAKIYATYKVVKGDCLWNIAKKYLGNGSRYPEIKKLNGLAYNTIYVGQVLKIPNK